MPDEEKNKEKIKGIFNSIREIKLDLVRAEINLALIIIAISLMSVVADILFLYISGELKGGVFEGLGKHGAELFFHAGVFAILGFIGTYVVQVLTRSEKLHESAQQLEVSFNQLSAQVIKKVYLASIKEMERFIRQNETQVIGRFLQEWRKEVEDALVLHDNKRLTVSHEILAIRSYEIFWKHLVKEQESRRGHPLTVLIIHSSSFDIWSKYSIGEKLLRSQKSFYDADGRATRILCAKGKPTEEVKKVAQSMKEAKVNVHYYDINTAKVDFDFAWDFLYVKETAHAVIWDSFNTGANIKDSTYQIGTHFREQDLEALWWIIERNLEERYRDESKWWDNC